jgi:O-acetyl-ADP-ribose deacetylase (regulator of RNase III)
MQTIRGDLVKLALEGRFDVIVHRCNCQCAMGAGIARTIKQVFPEAYNADLATAKGERAKLGTLSAAAVERNGRRLTIVNGYTQFHWHGSGALVHYAAVRSVMGRVKESYAGNAIGYPRIGAGLAGGDWDTIATII